MGSADIIVVMAIAFIIVAIVASSVYYFSRYYFKTSNDDPEVITKRPIEIGTEWKGPQKAGLGRPEFTKNALRDRLAVTRINFWGRISNAIAGPLFRGEIQGEVRDEIEEALYLSDIGPKTA